MSIPLSPKERQSPRHDFVITKDRTWIEAIYKQAFPNLVEILHNQEKETQIKGVDLYIKTKYETLIKVEEKIRYSDYGDLLLEDYSNYERRTPGWARDMAKITDYLAYIILPSRLAHIIYYPALRTLYLAHYSEWSQIPYEFGKTFDQVGNLLYTTANIPVPISEFPENWRRTNWWTYRAA